MAQRKTQGKKPPSRKASSGGKKAKPKTRRSSASSIESARAAWSGNLRLAPALFQSPAQVAHDSLRAEEAPVIGDH